MIKKAILFLFICASLTAVQAQGADKIKGRIVIMETSKGRIEIELFDNAAPISVANFFSYVEDGFYDGLIFHRVISNFVVQGGGLEPGLIEKTPKKSIVNEAKGGKPNRRGTVALARTSDINSASSQFYFNLSDNFMLDYQGNSSDKYGYAVFGRVIKGLDVVETISHVPTATIKGMSDVPIENVFIIKVWAK